MNWLFWRMARGSDSPGPLQTRADALGIGDKHSNEALLDAIEEQQALKARVESLEKRMEEIAPWLEP